MAITTADLQTLKNNNPSVEMGLFRDTSGVDNNRIIIYGLKDDVTTQTIVGTGVTLTGIEWQKAYYTTNKRMYFKPLTVTVT